MAPTTTDEDEEAPGKPSRLFRQTDDSEPGTTGLIFGGQFYPSEAELDAALSDEQKKQRIPKGRLNRPGGAYAQGSAYGPHGDPNKLPGRSGSKREQTSDIVDAIGRVNPTGGGGATSDDLSSLTVDELKELADAKGVTVTRGDGEEGKPRKQDYIDALQGA